VKWCSPYSIEATDDAVEQPELYVFSLSSREKKEGGRTINPTPHRVTTAQGQQRLTNADKSFAHGGDKALKSSNSFLLGTLDREGFCQRNYGMQRSTAMCAAFADKSMSSSRKTLHMSIASQKM